MNRIGKSVTALSCSLLLIAGCGGGSSDSTGSRVALNASLDSPDDAARALSAFALTQNEEGIGGALDGLDADDACNQGGSSDTEITSGSSALITFSNCRTRVSNGAETVDSALDGRVRLTCNDGGGLNCMDTSANIGDGGSLLADVVAQENGTTTADITATLSGDINVRSSETATSERDIVTSSLLLNATDQTTNQPFAIETDALVVDTTENDSGSTSTALDGAFRLNGLTDCLERGVRVSTTNTVTTNANGDTTSGLISIINNQGQEASISFLANGSVQITANNMTQTYTEQDLEGFCD